MTDIISETAERHGLTDEERAVLCGLVENRYVNAAAPAADENDHNIGVWRSIVSLAESFGAAEVINSKVCRQYPVDFASPETVRMEIYGSAAGDIPIIYAGNKDDFEALVTNIVHRGVRPANIEKTGASFVSGKNTRFIILSAKPYSNVTAAELGLESGGEWAEKSLLVRRSHECTHFFTKQRFGIADNRLHDELMADLMGLYDAFGFYRAEWFLRFMGVIEGNGGRLVVYTGELSPKLRAAVNDIVSAAARGLEEWSRSEGFAALDSAERICAMCAAGVAGMAEGRLVP